MSAVTFNRLEGQYTYSLESSTQSKNLKLLIDQSDAVLKVAIMNERGVNVSVRGDLIRGLPKTSYVPKEFFENAYSVTQS